MGDDRPAKQLLYSELVNGSCPVHRPKLHFFKDTLKTTHKLCFTVLINRKDGEMGPTVYSPCPRVLEV